MTRVRALAGICVIAAVLAGVATAFTRAPSRIVSIGAGTDFSCALRSRGDVQCWGRNDVGQLGRGTSDTLAHPEPARVALRGRAVALSVGREHACALRADGIAFCWGDDRMAESGAESAPEWCDDLGVSVACRTRPVRVTDVQRFRSIATGFRESCGITVEQRVLCWGQVIVGEDPRQTIGLDRCGAPESQSWCRRHPTTVPVQTSTQGSAPYPASFDTLALGAFASCGIANGYTYCWGHGERHGPTPGEITSVFGTGMRHATVGDEHACGVGFDSVVVCWGSPDLGALGRGDFATSPPKAYARKPFRPIDGIRRFVAVSVGGLHSCAIDDAAHLYCWGANQHGQLGVGIVDTITGPAIRAAHASLEPVDSRERFTQIAAGLEHSCALTINGQVLCWGRALRGSLGRETRSSARPVVIIEQ